MAATCIAAGYDLLISRGALLSQRPPPPVRSVTPLPYPQQRSVNNRWNSSMNMGSSKVSTSQRFAQPLVNEGQGSVFPVGLPLSKRRALEVEIIQRFDR